MIFLYLGASLIFQLEVAVQLQYIMLVLFTLAGCFGTYEIIRRVRILRMLFGLKMAG
jgi:hypothetical protein